RPREGLPRRRRLPAPEPARPPARGLAGLLPHPRGHRRAAHLPPARPEPCRDHVADRSRGSPAVHPPGEDALRDVVASRRRIATNGVYLPLDYSWIAGEAGY